MSHDMTLDEIEARLEELQDEREQADELRESFADARDALDDIRAHPLVDEEGAAKAKLIHDMVRLIGQHDIDPHECIHYEKRCLQEQAYKKKAEEAAKAVS